MFASDNRRIAINTKTNMLRTYFQETFYDMPVDTARKYAEAIRVAILAGKDFEGEKKRGFFLSKNRGFEDKLYIGNIHRIEDHLTYNDEELADDDQIVNVVVIDGPVTRDGDGCSYGSMDHRDQILYANTIPQVVGHLFVINTPGGAASARIDYEQAIADCREKGKPTVAWVDGMCCSAGQLVASLCDRTVVMNGRHTMGCIGTMCAFWGVANGTVDRDGYRYIELVSVSSPDKNAEYREAVDGKTEKLQAELDRLGEEFRNTVRQNRPMVKEEHLTGKTFEAKEVMGALVDEIGDYTRAIETVFELADETLTPARFVVESPEGNDSEKEDAEGQKDLAELSEQQKSAIANSHGDLRMVDGGHVTTDVDGFFGPETKEIANPQNKNTMTEEEKKAAEAQEANAEQQVSAEAPASTDSNRSKEEATGESASGINEASATAEPSDNGESEETNTPPAQEEIDKVKDALHNAEAVLAQRDQTIAEMKETLATLEGAIEERDSANAIVAEKEKVIEALNADKDTLNSLVSKKDETISEMRATVERLQAQVEQQKIALAEKEEELKEMAEKPTNMTNASSGVPGDNGTGGAPKKNSHQTIQRGMSYEEILAAQGRK